LPGMYLEKIKAAHAKQAVGRVATAAS